MELSRLDNYFEENDIPDQMFEPILGFAQLSDIVEFLVHSIDIVDLIDPNLEILSRDYFRDILNKNNLNILNGVLSIPDIYTDFIIDAYARAAGRISICNDWLLNREGSYVCGTIKDCSAIVICGDMYPYFSCGVQVYLRGHEEEPLVMIRSILHDRLNTDVVVGMLDTAVKYSFDIKMYQEEYSHPLFEIVKGCYESYIAPKT